MKTKWMAALLLSLTLTSAALADGAPRSQFGFSGWPYRQNNECTTNDTVQNSQQECLPPALPSTPGPTVIPEDSTVCPPPVLPDSAITMTPDIQATPTATPVATPDVTPSPEPTKEPEITPAPTSAPEATLAPKPTATATAVPTAKPTARPTATPEVKPTEKPAVPTVTPSAGQDYTTPSITMQEENAFLLLSQDRAKNGRSQLQLDPMLCSIARIKSCDMKNNRYFAHESPTYGSASNMLKTFGYSFTSVGENIAHHATVEKSQAAFMSSEGHRRNILGTQWTKVGIGVCVDDNGYVYVTQLFVR